MPARIISPELAFNARMRVAKGDTTQGKATITKAEAEKALQQLETPRTSQAEKARIVQQFLDGRDASALSPKAREVLADFVTRHSDRPTGDNAAEVRRAARQEASEAQANLQKATDRLDKLLTGGLGRLEVRSGLAQVNAWLDAAEADVMQAKAQLKKIATDARGKAAAKELGTAQKEIAKAAEDVSKLVSKAKAGGVRKADLEEVRSWLAGPLPELERADGKLAPDRMTRKFPSDNEDHGGGGGAVTEKFPSDNEDGGGGGGGAVTEKFPSDNEDGGGGGGGGAVTLKYPSDNEDGGHGGGGGVYHTMKAPSDNEDHGGGGGGVNDPSVKPARVDTLRKAFNKVNLAGTLNWNPGSVMESHLGVRFARVELMRERHPDGFTYTAFIPVGALSPTATRKDPNKVKEFYIERSGGFAGMTFSAGPLKL